MSPGVELPFREIWCVDFEFRCPDGDTPQVRCMVAKEVRSGRTIRLWADECMLLSEAPFDSGAESLVVAYYSSAEWGCFLSLGWKLPENVLDLFAEFRSLTNGLPPIRGNGLVGALTHFGLTSLETEEKDSMRQLAMREGSEYTGNEKASLLAYCESDVDGTCSLFARMIDGVDLALALLRGRYMKAVATIERNGIPIDMQMLARLKASWSDIRKALIRRVDDRYQVYEGESFKSKRFEEYLERRQIPWPRTDLGALRLGEDTFEEMAKVYPELEPLRQLRATLSRLKLNQIAIGPDGRNRCLLSPFRSITGRNQPSTAKFVYGLPSWMRHIIKPKPGMGLAYIDWSQQEIGIAAALSQDRNMMAAYESGDFYLTFAKQAGAVPANATKATHKNERELFKQFGLAVGYGMGEKSLAGRIGQHLLDARKLLDLHRSTYPDYWRWSQGALNRAMAVGQLHTVFGWKLNTPADPNGRSLQNFPVQANGAEMLRLAVCLITEAGIRVCAPVHDAVLVEAPLEELDDAVVRTQMFMRVASEVILDGFALKTEPDVIRYPDRFVPEKGIDMWATVQSCLGDIEKSPTEAA